MYERFHLPKHYVYAKKLVFSTFHPKISSLDSNLCLRVPEKMQKTRGESDPSRLRKLSKSTQNKQNLNLADFWQFLDVFSVKDDQIDL